MKKIDKLLKGDGCHFLEYTVDAKTPDFLIQWFDSWLDNYCQDIGQTQDQRIVNLGFFDLKVTVDCNTVVLQAPDLKQLPLTWCIDLSAVLDVATRHQYIPQSYDLEFDIPSMNETVIISERFDELPVFLSRTEKDPDTNHSGWFITSLSDNGDNTDEETLKVISLYEAIVKAPRLINYLSMPEGTQIVFETSAPIIMYRNKVLRAGKTSFVKKTLASGAIDNQSMAI